MSTHKPIEPVKLDYTPVTDIAGVVAQCREGARKQVLHSVPARKEALRAMYRLIKENEKALLDALQADLGKHPVEGFMTEFSTYNEIFYALDHLDDWVKEKPADMEGPLRLLGCTVKYDPLGCVLVIGAWNYPLVVTLNPVIGALAAGNTVVLKPSEVAPATAKVLTELVAKYFSPDVMSVVNGGVEETTELLQNNTFDHIIYTGSGTVGRIVMAAAAKHLTPVCLELGGKSPTIVDETCTGSAMDVVAARIAWAKYTNSGQTCVAPDYVLVHESVKDAFIEAFKAKRAKFMKGASDITADPSYSRIVNDRQYQRLAKMLDGSCGKVVVGGEQNPETLQIGVTLLDEVRLDSPLMQDEIFGPLLPLVPYKHADDVVNFVNARPKPLALYVFSTNKAFVRRLKAETSSGGMVVNDLMLQVAIDNLPFGGVGGSGMGNYHGLASFKTFSHAKSILNDTLGMEGPKSVRYPPYSDKKAALFRSLLVPQGEKSAIRKMLTSAVTSQTFFGLSCFVAGMLVAVAYTKNSLAAH